LLARHTHGAFTIVAPNPKDAHSIALHNQHPARAKTFAAVTPRIREVGLASRLQTCCIVISK
jgi:hypothetical protein